ncbi:hypothetical protein EUGRSUZ_J03000 [Eucalyptus grandis]|uniref:Uncharacterized protein n=2 Tax=Eucalyptus grandis TaxID=71139 RepID=A0ACC3JAB5_EUCGR|nr:hypothetical protein EUGRSUZ_J03000 [Eucalyptus grandis]
MSLLHQNEIVQRSERAKSVEFHPTQPCIGRLCYKALELPTLPYVLSASDDSVIKLWDWEKDWTCSQCFCKCITRWNYKGTLFIWNVHSSAPKVTLDGHEKGLNFVDYFSRDDVLYLLSGSDDYTAKVWDDKGRSCIQTLEGHEHNVTAVCAHPELPIVITGSEDETLRMWDANGFGLKHVVRFGHGRIWDIAYQKGSRRVVVACDEGIAVVEIVC